ncbi:unnamed protein product, partial [Pleuronectes platessa]
MGREGLWFVSGSTPRRDNKRRTWIDLSKNPRVSLPCLVPLSKAPYSPNICSPSATTSITVNTMEEDDSDPVHSESLMDCAFGPKTTPEETTSITVNTMEEDDSDPVHSESLMDCAFGPKTTPEE